MTMNKMMIMTMSKNINMMMRNMVIMIHITAKAIYLTAMQPHPCSETPCLCVTTRSLGFAGLAGAGA